jgi:CubicO group peptidase (beta-lactamase class C family)
VRGSHAPDTFWYYNNWDFNVLGTIFEQETGTGIFEEYKARIADPIGMQDFSLDLCDYFYEWDLSIHPAYPFQMSARDRARFGQLFLQEGRWNETRIISRNWIRTSTKAFSDASFGVENRRGIGYGFMWWTIAGDVPYFQEFEHLKDMGAGYYAAGYGGHVIVILPEQETVFVLVVDTFHGLQVSGGDSYTLMDKIFSAREQEIFDLSALKARFGPRSVSRGENITLSARVKNLSRRPSLPTGVDFYLSADEKLNARDVHIGYTELPEIKYKKKKYATLNTIILDTVEPGEYTVIARVDRDDVNLDPWPQNNVAVSKQKLVLK